MKNRVARLLLGAGLLLAAASLFLFQSNASADRQAGEAARELLSEWNAPVSSAPSQTGESAAPALPEEVLGVLSVPSLSLELPVLDQYSDELLERSVCRYSGGGPAESGFVIAGHSYHSHFGKLSHLEHGDELTFRDRDGGVTRYTVERTEFISGADPDALRGDDWDLTLFTCTFDGADRLLVRCQKSS